MRPEKVLPEARFAVETVEKAALLASRIQAGRLEPSLSKSDRSPVTVADLAVQALVARLLHEAFPGDALVAEEESSEISSDLGGRLLASASRFLRTILPDATPAKVREWLEKGEADARPDRFWTLDPIDGTKGFLRGRQYAVALALITDGRPTVGALGCPNLSLGEKRGTLAVAVQEKGAWASCLGKRSFRKLAVSRVTRSDEATVVRSLETGHTDAKGFELFVRKLGTPKLPLLMDSQAKYALLADGRGDVLLRMLSPSRPGYRERIWDHAAGSLLVEEAGGKVTDLHGTPLNFGNGRRLEKNVGVAASNGILHDAVLEALESLSGQLTQQA